MRIKWLWLLTIAHELCLVWKVSFAWKMKTCRSNKPGSFHRLWFPSSEIESTQQNLEEGKFPPLQCCSCGRCTLRCKHFILYHKNPQLRVVSRINVQASEHACTPGSQRERVPNVLTCLLGGKMFIINSPQAEKNHLSMCHGKSYGLLYSCLNSSN